MFKLILTLIVIGLLLYALGDLYIFINARGKEKKVLDFVTKNNKMYPAFVLEAYNKVYKNASTNKVRPDLFWYLLNRKKLRDYPQINLAYQQTRTSKVELFCYAIALSNVATPNDCINAFITNFDYLNGIIGIEQAAQHYFNKKLTDLNSDEILELIAILDNPDFYNKFNYPEHLKRRINFILQK